MFKALPSTPKSSNFLSPAIDRPGSNRTPNHSDVLRRMGPVGSGPFSATNVSHNEGRSHAVGREWDGTTAGGAGVSQWLARTEQNDVVRPPLMQRSHTTNELQEPKHMTRKGPPARAAESEGIDSFLSRLREGSVEQAPKPPRKDTLPRGLSSRQVSPDMANQEWDRSQTARPSAPASTYQPADILFTLSPTVYQPYGNSIKRDDDNKLTLETTAGQQNRSKGSLRPEVRPDSPPPAFVFPPKSTRAGKSLHTPTDSCSSEASISGSDYRSVTSSPATSATSGMSRRLSNSSAPDEQLRERGVWWRKQGMHSRSASKSPHAAVARSRPDDGLGKSAPTYETLPSTRYGEKEFRDSLSPHNTPSARHGEQMFHDHILSPRSAPPTRDGDYKTQGASPSQLTRAHFTPPASDRDMELPSDPAVQMGLWSWRQRLMSNAPPHGQTSSSASSSRTASPAPAMRANGQKTTPGSKGKCRGCEQDIFGKSVKAGDGRLTGRYHKQCESRRTNDVSTM